MAKRSRKRTAPARNKPKRTPTPGPQSNFVADDPAPPSHREKFPIVGVGGSAGGLEAFSQLLGALPAEPGLSIILISHLAPQHASALPALLRTSSAMAVVEAAEGIEVRPNHVYVIPPNVQMGITRRRLHLNPRPTDRTQYTPLDFFLRTLADSEQEQAIAVVLSGTGSDGAAGVRDIKAAGGITFAQRPNTARYEGMPRAAIATGAIDLVLSPVEIAAELVHLASHPFISGAAEALELVQLREEEPSGITDSHLTRIFALLRAATGVDFRHYKLPTIIRRLHRRMAIQKISGVDRYLRLLEEKPAEVALLYQDILIHVTRFFREPASFEALTAHVYPRLLSGRDSDAPLRVWVCGCATGEEAYSVAITLLEYLGDGSSSAAIPIQIFATDVSESAIEFARNGIYPGSIDGDVSPERLQRFFVKVDGSYRVSKMIRDLCVFARQDLTRDPPFSRIDLILCRNVLIYMDITLQRKLIALFHYALKPGGFLMLGHAETVGANTDLFAVADKRYRLYTRQAVDSLPLMRFPVELPSLPQRPQQELDANDSGKLASIRHEANRLLLDRYSPPGVIVDSEFHILQFRGQTGLYLEPAPGDPSLSVLKMARDGLLFGLRTALQAARKTKKLVRRTGVSVRANGGWRSVDLEVIPLPVGERMHYLVIFIEPAGRDEVKKQPKAPRARRREEASRVSLEQELAASREHLQSIIQDLEAANEELQSANEEILSSNEELQSTNEELDTAKEELQSSNEELNTLNEELHGRNDELSRVNSDLLNLLGCVEIAIVIVASDLRIRRFTPMAERVLNLIPGDIGRPIGHIKPNIDCPQLESLITETVDKMVATECEVRDQQGVWYSLRIRPYRNVENRIDGAVLALFDIDHTKRAEEEIRRAHDLARALQDSMPEPTLLVDDSGRVHSANRAFREKFGLSQGQAEGKDLFDLPVLGSTLRDVRGRIEPLIRNGDGSPSLALYGNGSGPDQQTLTVRGLRVDLLEGSEHFTVLTFEDARSSGD
jgi:two-component system CheB/CheR fusion protein